MLALPLQIAVGLLLLPQLRDYVETEGEVMNKKRQHVEAGK